MDRSGSRRAAIAGARIDAAVDGWTYAGRTSRSAGYVDELRSHAVRAVNGGGDHTARPRRQHAGLARAGQSEQSAPAVDGGRPAERANSAEARSHRAT